MRNQSSKAFADKEQQDRVVQLYLEGHSTTEIAAMYNRSGKAVRNLLKMRKVKARTVTEQWQIRLARGERPFAAGKVADV